MDDNIISRITNGEATAAKDAIFQLILLIYQALFEFYSKASIISFIGLHLQRFELTLFVSLTTSNMLLVIFFVVPIITQ